MDKTESAEFQSLSGFQVRCNCCREDLPETGRWFQSLSGFQVRCNSELLKKMIVDRFCFNPYRVFKFVATKSATASILAIAPFQSLSGFQVRCNCCLSRLEARRHRVSIPIGFSSSLQRLARPCYTFSFAWFQSLSGFQVRCNEAGAVIS